MGVEEFSLYKPGQQYASGTGENSYVVSGFEAAGGLDGGAAGFTTTTEGDGDRVTVDDGRTDAEDGDGEDEGLTETEGAGDGDGDACSLFGPSLFTSDGLALAGASFSLI